MKQNYSWFRNNYKKFLSTFALVFMVSAMFAQTLVNGNLGTGATSLNGTAAAAGTTWHELQNVTGNTTESNSLLGVPHAATGTTTNSLADNFVVPGGNTWTINTLTVYSLDQVTAPTSTTSPYTNIRVRIWNGAPGVAGSTVIFGDLTTNRFASTAFSGRKGIFNSKVPTPTPPIPDLPIFSITANLGTTVVLTEGTYWVEWQVVNAAVCFSPTSQTVGIRTLPAYNARQFSSAASVWSQIVDAGSPASAPDVAADLPFTLSYTAAPIVPCAGTPAPGNTLTTNSSACPGSPFFLSLQNAVTGTGITYQWQRSTTGVGGPYTDIAGAINPTYGATITVTTFFRAVVTCSGINGTSTPVGVNSIACYCNSSADVNTDEEIFNVTFGNLNNSSTCTTVAPGPGSLNRRYSNYTGYQGAPVANVVRSSSTSLSIQIGTCGDDYPNSAAVWIDYNQDGTFAATERVYVSAATTFGPHLETANITIPATATLGTTRMRVINVEADPSQIEACGPYNWGETEDYNVNIMAGTPCTGAPAPGNTLSTATSVCSGTQGFTLSLQNNQTADGLSYQWFSGPSATGTIFTAIAGATNPTLSVGSITSATCYYAAVTCSAVTTNSTPVCVSLNSAFQCYCLSSAFSTEDEDIFRVTLGTLSNVSTCATLAPGPGSIQNRYSNYESGTGAPAAPDLATGATYPLEVQIGTCGDNYGNAVAVYIDYNRDGTFQIAETVYRSLDNTVGPHVEGGDITIPGNAVSGLTRMRVVNVETTLPTDINPCGSYTRGETEDYIVNIINNTPCTPLTIATAPVSKSALCGSATFLSAVITGSGPILYQWQVQTTPGGAWA
ncbi:MAG: GEVED domain-containing protein, partial [Ferruginibacter sp.]